MDVDLGDPIYMGLKLALGLRMQAHHMVQNDLLTEYFSEIARSADDALVENLRSVYGPYEEI